MAEDLEEEIVESAGKAAFGGESLKMERFIGAWKNFKFLTVWKY
jgi:hypothetical protein